jgi:hypothetical protein
VTGTAAQALVAAPAGRRGDGVRFSIDWVAVSSSDFDTPALPTCDAQIWPTTFRCIVQFPV